MDSNFGENTSFSVEFGQMTSFKKYLDEARRLTDFSMLDSPIPKLDPDKKHDLEVRKMKKSRSNDHSPERPVSRGGSMRENEYIISELKKECFGLKLRIYYMEEQLRETFDTSAEDMFKINVELKVAIEQLKNEIGYKTELLTKASQAMEQMSLQIEQSDSQFRSELEEDFKKAKVKLEKQLLEKDKRIKQLEDGVDEVRSNMNDTGNKEHMEQNRLHQVLEEKDEQYKLLEIQKQQDEDSLKSMIRELEQTIATKESNIETLRNDVRRLASNPERSNQHYKALYERSSKELADKDKSLLQIKSELANKSSLAESFRDHISSLEKGLKGMRATSHEKESEMQRTISHLQEEIKHLKLTKGLQDEIQVKRAVARDRSSDPQQELECKLVEKDEKLEVKDKALLEVKEEKLRANQKRMQFELETVKNKESRIIELEIQIKQQMFDCDKLQLLLERKDKDIVELEKSFSVQQKESDCKSKDLDERLMATEAQLKKTKVLLEERDKDIEEFKSSFNKANELLVDVTEKLNTADAEVKRLKLKLEGKDKDIAEMKKCFGSNQEENDRILRELMEKLKIADREVEKLKLIFQEKEKYLEDLKASSLAKQEKSDRIVTDLMEKYNASTAQVKELKSALLKTKNAEELVIEMFQNTLSEKDKVIQAITKNCQDKDKLLSSENDELQNKNQLIDMLRSRIEELKAPQNTNDNLDYEKKENASASHVIEIARIFVGASETYKLLVKIVHQRNTDSQSHTSDDFGAEHIRKYLRLQMVLNKYMLNKDEMIFGDIDEDQEMLQIQLEDIKRCNRSLEEQFSEYDTVDFRVSLDDFPCFAMENKREEELVKENLQQCEINAKYLTKQISKTKFDYDQIIREKDEEISALTKKMKQEKQLITVLAQQNDNAKQELVNKEKQFESARMESLQKCHNDTERKSDLQEKLEMKEKCVSDMEKQISVLKKDIKELYDMNVRLRKKTKSYELLISKKDSEKERSNKEIVMKRNENHKLQTELKELKKSYERLSAQFTESKTLISSLNMRISSSNDSSLDISKLKEEIKQLKETKTHLKERYRKTKECSEEAKRKMSITLEESHMKEEEIKILKSRLGDLEEKLESFSPLQTSSTRNLALSIDAFTQTISSETQHFGNEDNNSLITLHIKEMQELRKQLEVTINNNNALRTQLEERLNQVEYEASQLRDPQLRITLIRDNDKMREKLNESEMNEKKLKLHIEELKDEKEKDKDTISTLESQLHELNIISANLKVEMEVYDRLVQQLGIDKNRKNNNKDLDNFSDGSELDKNLLLALLEEIRDLREQLQTTVDVNNLLREKLEKELGHPVQEKTLQTPRNLTARRTLFSDAILRTANSIAQKSGFDITQSLADYTSLDQTPTKDQGIDISTAPSWASSNLNLPSDNTEDECVILGKVDDFKKLQHLTSKALDLLSSSYKKLKSNKENSANLFPEISKVHKLLKEISLLLSTFTISENKEGQLKAEKQLLQLEILHMKESIISKENIQYPMQPTKEMVNLDDSEEQEIAIKLLKACKTLKTTKGNLQLKVSRPPSRNNSPSN